MDGCQAGPAGPVTKEQREGLHARLTALCGGMSTVEESDDAIHVYIEAHPEDAPVLTSLMQQPLVSKHGLI